MFGGIAIARLGLNGAYGIHVGLSLAAVAVLVFVRTVNPRERRGSVTIGAIKEGLQYVRHRPIILGPMTVDLFAVVFGGATALLPIYAEDILHVGAQGFGALTSAQAIGSFVAALALMAAPPIRRTGRALIYAAAAFGLVTVVFGFSRSYALSLLALGLIGAVDQVSVVMRQTTIQLNTPDELRGRVSSVNQVFIGTSNHIGAVESGLVAAITSATFAVVSGGIVCLGVVAAVGARFPELWRYRVGSEHLGPDSAPKEAVQSVTHRGADVVGAPEEIKS
jgi:MFS family permease